MSDAVKELIDYCLKAKDQDLLISFLEAHTTGSVFLYNLKHKAHAAQEQLTQQAENVSKPEATNADETKTLRDEMAMAALTRFLWERSTGVKDLAHKCYEYAEAMLEARRKK